jgi:ketosteroid isomerase-like protein
MAGQAKAPVFIEALRRLEREHEIDGLASLYAQDAEVQNPTDRTPRRGIDGAREFWRQYRGTFKEIESEFRNVVESGQVAMLEWTSRGRFAGGDQFEYSGVSVIEYDGDQIRRFCAYFDPATLGAQVGQPGAA